METGCPRAAYLAALLLEQVANDTDADDHLREHARDLVEVLERGNHRALERRSTRRRGAASAGIAEPS